MNATPQSCKRGGSSARIDRIELSEGMTGLQRPGMFRFDVPRYRAQLPYRFCRRFIHSVPRKACLCSEPHGKSHTATGMFDNKRKYSVGLLPRSLSPSPPVPYLKYLEVDGGTSLSEAVSRAPVRGASLGLIGLW